MGGWCLFSEDFALQESHKRIITRLGLSDANPLCFLVWQINANLPCLLSSHRGVTIIRLIL